MSQDKIQKLKSFLETISVTDDNLQTMSAQEFIPIERKLGYKLPDDYKYFCQKLGSGEIADFVDFFCINNDALSDSTDATEEMTKQTIYGLEQIKLNDGEDSSRYQSNLEYFEMLKSILVFGSFNEHVFFWNLRSYQEDDDSYDIYWHTIDDIDSDGLIKICRKFTDFICDFCYGQLACQLKPDFCDGSDREVSYKFNPFRYIDPNLYA
jgi:SMI1 / KNR4 family (SUKH-1)